MHKSALPVVVRQTLNNAAYDLKTTTMPKEAKKTFAERKPTFFKSHSRVEAAEGWDIDKMEATTGFQPSAKDKKAHSVQDLKQQEEGGAIDDRALIASQRARTGGNWRRMVKKEMTIPNVLQKNHYAKQVKGSSPAQRYVKTAIYAGKGGLVMNEATNGKEMGIYKIRTIKRIYKDRKNGKTGKRVAKGRKPNYTVVVSDLIYSFKKGRKAHVKATHFMQHASQTTAEKMEGYYITNAKKKLKL